MSESQQTNETDLQTLSLRGVARLLGVSVATVERWRRDCPEFPLPRAFSSKTRRWFRAEVVEWATTRAPAR